MMEEPLSRGASPSGGSSLSGGGELGIQTNVALEERLQDVSTRHSINLLRTPPAKKAKRVRFFRNGDKFYTGVVMAVTPERYRSFDSLATDLTRALISNVTLPNGVRSIYTMDGRKVVTVGDLEDGKCYVCSGQGEAFKKVEYSSSKVRRGSSLSGLPQSPAGSGRPATSVPVCVQAKIVTLIRHGTKPRRVLRLLLNKRNAPSLEHALEAITEAVKLDSGAVRKVYTLSGIQVTMLEQFFQNEEIFLAYGTDKSSQEDFELDFEESKAVQSFRRGPCLSKRHGGPMPPMPKKSGKKALTVPQVRTPSPVFVQLPLPLRMHFVAGHVIGDGNFAIVRHCVQRRTGLEYALKIIDKYKCQGQGTMLDSEIAIMRQVCHPNIISLVAEQETTDQLFLVMELVKGGDLFDAIAAATKFSEPEASVMISHLTSALAYLHAHHIVHRDVKPENLLVEMEGSRVTCLKLGDFGLAQVVREPLYTVCGTPTYVAPEILAETGYGLKIDVWAAGVIMYILLCGFPPFVSPENEQEELFERILSGHYEYTAPYWDSVSDSAKQLVSNMLQVQPELRFSAEDVLDHPWLASFLGGESTADTTATTESSKQYWNKQRKPIRQATYDFNCDYKSRKKQQQSEFSTLNSSDNVPLSSSDTRINQIDFPTNGYCNVNEPQSLDTQCLEDIRAMTKSMHDLMHNIIQIGDSGDDNSKEISNSAKNSTSSFNDGSNLAAAVPNDDNSDAKKKQKQQKKKKMITKHGGSTSEITCGNGIESDNRYSSVKNGNSDISISKNVRKTQKYGSGGNINAIKRVAATKTTKSSERLESLKKMRHGSSDSSAISDTGVSKFVTRSFAEEIPPAITSSKTPRNLNERVPKSTKYSKNRYPDTVDCSKVLYYDGRSSSDNDIETSDSFVNIQFAKFAHGQNSSSSHSIESTDSFENIQIMNFNINENVYETNLSNQVSKNRETEASGIPDNEKTDQNLSEIETALSAAGISKSVKKLQNSIQSEKLNKGEETKSNKKGEKMFPVKRREKKSTVSHISNSTDELNSSRNETSRRNKRYSCHTPNVGRKLRSDTKCVNERSNNSSSGGEYSINKNKRFNSTDELSDTKNKNVNKSKRYSLYYTPQPSRKNYNNDITEGIKNEKKLMNDNISNSLSAGRRTALTKNFVETNTTQNSRKDNIKSRKSVAQTTTAASRNRSNKQNVHIRSDDTVSASASQAK